MKCCLSAFSFLICFFFYSCDYFRIEKKGTPPFYNGPADITVINTTTLDTARYRTGLSTSYSDGEVYYSSSIKVNEKTDVYQKDTLYFHKNDQMKVIFTPPTMFSEKTYNVRYLVFDLEEIVTVIPYEFNCTVYSDIPTGYYNLDCYAMSPSWDQEKSKCYQTCVFRVVE